MPRKDTTVNVEDSETELEIKVQRMACEGCAETVAKAAKAVAGVADAVVDLKAGTVKVTGRAGAIDRRQLTDAIRAAGYTAS